MTKQLWSIALILALSLLCAGCQKENKPSESPTQSQSSIPVTESSTPEALSSAASEMLVDPGIQQKGAIDGYLASFEAQLEKEGLSLESKVVKDAAAIGALEGYGFNINNMPLEVYLFDPANADEQTAENLKTAKESGYITFFGMEINGKTIQPACTLHNNLVLIFPAEDFGIAHPNKAAIIQAFESITQ